MSQKDGHTGDKPVEVFVEEADGFAEVFPEHKYKARLPSVIWQGGVQYEFSN